MGVNVSANSIVHMLRKIKNIVNKKEHVFHKPDNHSNQSRTNGPIYAHLTIAQVMPKYNHNNEKQEALL